MADDDKNEDEEHIAVVEFCQKRIEAQGGEAWLRDRLVESLVPENDHDGLVRYILHGIPPGHFLRAVLKNDLAEACARADSVNQRALWDVVFFLHNYAPRACWGQENVTPWLTAHQTIRERARAAGGQS